MKKTLMLVILILGWIFCFFGCSAALDSELDPLSRDFSNFAHLIWSKEEKDIFRHLPDPEARQEFIQDFWMKRDPDPETPENEFRMEFLRRIEYANRIFREGIPGWKTDRGRIYIYLGRPDVVEEKPFLRGENIKGLIYWRYFDHKFSVWFVDRMGTGSYTVFDYLSGHGERLSQVLERAKFGRIPRGGDGFKDRYVDFDLEYECKRQEILVLVPVADLVFRDEAGLLSCDLEFAFYIYKKNGNWRYKFRQTRNFQKPQQEVVNMETAVFIFPLGLGRGEYYVDIVITGKQTIGKTRKMFKIKV